MTEEHLEYRCGIEDCPAETNNWIGLASHINRDHPGYLPPRPLPDEVDNLRVYDALLALSGSSAPTPTAHEAWNACMEAVRVVAKREENTDQHFVFRGVDAVVNAMGPVMRDNGVHVIPHRVKLLSRTEYETKRYESGRGGTRMVNSVVKVKWRVYGPRGDWFPGESIGEAADAGDKGVTKAESVAWRVFLIQAGALPTDDQDPDSTSHERASHAVAEGQEEEVPAHIREAIAAADEARGELLSATQGYGWTEEKLVRRYWDDYRKNLRNTHDVEAIGKFKDMLVAEAKAQGQNRNRREGRIMTEAHQFSLFDDPGEAHARNTDPVTSHEAAAHASKKMRLKQRAVLDVLARLGPSTDVDLVDGYYRLHRRLGHPQQADSGIRTRRDELRRQGLVVDTGLKAILATGRRAIVWAAVDKAGEPIMKPSNG